MLFWPRSSALSNTFQDRLRGRSGRGWLDCLGDGRSGRSQGLAGAAQGWPGPMALPQADRGAWLRLVHAYYRRIVHIQIFGEVMPGIKKLRGVTLPNCCPKLDDPLQTLTFC